MAYALIDSTHTRWRAGGAPKPSKHKGALRPITGIDNSSVSEPQF
jgi:hypothetical protein